MISVVKFHLRACLTYNIIELLSSKSPHYLELEIACGFDLIVVFYTGRIFSQRSIT